MTIREWLAQQGLDLDQQLLQGNTTWSRPAIDIPAKFIDITITLRIPRD